MTNAKLIKALRNCADYSDCGICKLNGKSNCADIMMRDAADAIERLQSDLDKKNRIIKVMAKKVGQLIDIVNKENHDDSNRTD